MKIISVQTLETEMQKVWSEVLLDSLDLDSVYL